MKFVVKVFCLGGLLLGAAPTARAQQSVESIMDSFSSVLNNNIGLSHAAATNTTGVIYGQATTSAAKAPAARLAYVPTPAVRQKAIATAARRLQPNNPGAADKLTATFGPGRAGDYTTFYAKLIQGAGLRDNNVADAFAAYLVGTYRVASGQAPAGPLLPAGVGRGVSAQYAPLLTRAVASRPASAAELGEYFKFLTVLVYVGAQDKTGGLPAFRQNVAETLRKQFGIDVNTLALSSQGFGPRGGVADAGAARPVASGVAPAGATAVAAGSSAAAGAQWFFRARSGVGAAVSFEPVVLLANGQYFDIGDELLETLNVAAARARHPAAWGTWRKSGRAFVLTNAKGQANSYALSDGSGFPAYPAEAMPLKQAYENASGGNIGAATSLLISKIQFVDGTYRLQGHTLTL